MEDLLKYHLELPEQDYWVEWEEELVELILYGTIQIKLLPKSSQQ